MCICAIRGGFTTQLRRAGKRFRLQGRIDSPIPFMLVGGTIPASILSGGQVYAREAGQICSIQGLIVQVAQIGPFPVAGRGCCIHDRQFWEAALGVLLAAAVCGTALGQLALRAIGKSIRREVALVKWL